MNSGLVTGAVVGAVALSGAVDVNANPDTNLPSGVTEINGPFTVDYTIPNGVQGITGVCKIPLEGISSLDLVNKYELPPITVGGTTIRPVLATNKPENLTDEAIAELELNIRTVFEKINGTLPLGAIQNEIPLLINDIDLRRIFNQKIDMAVTNFVPESIDSQAARAYVLGLAMFELNEQEIRDALGETPTAQLLTRLKTEGIVPGIEVSVIYNIIPERIRDFVTIENVLKNKLPRLDPNEVDLLLNLLTNNSDDFNKLYAAMINNQPFQDYLKSITDAPPQDAQLRAQAAISWNCVLPKQESATLPLEPTIPNGFIWLNKETIDAAAPFKGSETPREAILAMPSILEETLHLWQYAQHDRRDPWQHDYTQVDGAEMEVFAHIALPYLLYQLEIQEGVPNPGYPTPQFTDQNVARFGIFNNYKGGSEAELQGEMPEAIVDPYMFGMIMAQLLGQQNPNAKTQIIQGTPAEMSRSALSLYNSFLDFIITYRPNNRDAFNKMIEENNWSQLVGLWMQKELGDNFYLDLMNLMIDDINNRAGLPQESPLFLSTANLDTSMPGLTLPNAPFGDADNELLLGTILAQTGGKYTKVPVLGMVPVRVNSSSRIHISTSSFEDAAGDQVVNPINARADLYNSNGGLVRGDLPYVDGSFNGELLNGDDGFMIIYLIPKNVPGPNEDSTIQIYDVTLTG